MHAAKSANELVDVVWTEKEQIRFRRHQTAEASGLCARCQP